MTLIINGKSAQVTGGLSDSTKVLPLTSAEYEALSEEDRQADILYIITDDNDGSNNGPNNITFSDVYSEEEVRIGTYFGKPLYRRAFKLSGISLTLPNFPNKVAGESVSTSVNLISSGFLDETVFDLYDVNLYTIFSIYFSSRNYRTPYTTSAYTGEFINLQVGGNKNIGPTISVSSVSYLNNINVSQPFGNVSGVLVYEYTKVTDPEATI